MLRGFINVHPFYNSDGGGSGGGSDPSEGFKRLLDKHNNDALRVADRLFEDNYKEREQNRQLKARIAELEGKVPGNGAVVLSADDAAAWEAYRALGKLDDVKRQIAERNTFASELSTHRKNAVLREAAEAHTFKPSVLQRLAADLEIEVKEIGDGKDRRKVAIVKDGDNEIALDKYADREWADFLPSLRADGQQADDRQRKPADINAVARTTGKPDRNQVIQSEAERLKSSGRYGGF